MHRVNLVSFSFMIAFSISCLVMHSCLTGGEVGSGLGVVCQMRITLPEEDFLSLRRFVSMIGGFFPHG